MTHKPLFRLGAGKRISTSTSAGSCCSSLRGRIAGIPPRGSRLPKDQPSDLWPTIHVQPSPLAWYHVWDTLHVPSQGAQSQNGPPRCSFLTECLFHISNVHFLLSLPPAFRSGEVLWSVLGSGEVIWQSQPLHWRDVPGELRQQLGAWMSQVVALSYLQLTRRRNSMYWTASPQPLN